MESVRKKWKDLPLRRFFILTVFGTICLVVALSGLVIWGCVAFREYLLPESDAVYLTIERTMENGEKTTETYLMRYGQEPEQIPMLLEVVDGEPVEVKGVREKYAIQKIETTFESLTPKRKLAYQVCGITMVVAPAMFSFVGILLCGMYFYRQKLKEPLELLEEATERIADQDLDFTLDYECGDELGNLSKSFERMREVLQENNKAMWEMWEERRLLQASVAHDLRNPIAIIQGYTEYLESGFEKGSVGQEKLIRILRNLNLASKRLGNYTESVGLLNRWEETELHKKNIPVAEFAETVAEDFRLLARQEGISLKVVSSLPMEKIWVDDALLYRVLENIVSNALRYARQEIILEFSLLRNGSERRLVATVADDGEGFGPEVLEKKSGTLLTPGADGHMGIGLSVSRILCKKQGGGLELGNGKLGAWVKVWVKV